MNRPFRAACFAACSLALLLAVGGHWVALQSVAWGRMLLDYSRADSFATAVRKTFDGDHPCSMCLQIREGRAQAEREQEDEPWMHGWKAPELFFESHAIRPIVRAAVASNEVAYVPDFPSDFIDPPPKPPPRA